MRTQTRIERYNQKLKFASYISGYLVTINFSHDDNLGLLIRAAACFGFKGIMVIGSIPPRNFLRPKSGSTLEYVPILTFSNPASFLRYCREQDIRVLSVELTDKSQDIRKFPFAPHETVAFVVGNESYGIPEEILVNTQHIQIPMPGPGYCLNSAQAGTLVAWEYYRRLDKEVSMVLESLP